MGFGAGGAGSTQGGGWSSPSGGGGTGWGAPSQGGGGGGWGNPYNQQLTQPYGYGPQPPGYGYGGGSYGFGGNTGYYGGGYQPQYNASTRADFAPLPGGGPQGGQGNYPNALAPGTGHGSTPATVDWSQAPVVNPGQYAGGANKAMWQKSVGQDENWIQQEEGRGARITGAVPNMFQGDINNLNRYGTFTNNVNLQNNTEWVPSTSGTPDPNTGQLGYWRPMNQSTVDTINNYENWAYNEENKQGGGAVADWGKYQGYGPNTAAGNWGGAYSAYMANQAIQAGVAPGAGYGFGTTAGSSPLGYGPNGTYYNMLRGGAQYFDQYGVPIAGPQGGGGGQQQPGGWGGWGQMQQPYLPWGYGPQPGPQYGGYGPPPSPYGGFY